MLNHRKLFLVCGYCECKYANLDLFEKHLRQQHRIFEGCRNEVNVVPKMEIKKEMFVITEVVGQQDHIRHQAMVSIPPEIPLDISISPENEMATLAALDETMEIEDDIHNEQPSSSCAAAVVSLEVTKNLLDCGITNENSNSKDSENLLQAMDVAKHMVTKKTRNKRRSSPLKSLASPNKRPKRITRKSTKVLAEATQTIVEVNLTDEITATETIPLIETENVNETIKSKETRPKRGAESKKTTTEHHIATKSNEADLATVTESTEAKEIAKTSKSAQTKTANTTETSETKKSLKNAQTKKSSSPETVDTEKISKVVEFKKAITPEMSENKKITKSIESKKTKRIETKMTDNKNETTPETLIETKKPSPKEIKETKETKKPTKATESKKVIFIETTEIKKSAITEESTKPATSVEMTESLVSETNEPTPPAIIKDKESENSLKTTVTKEATIVPQSSETKVNNITIKAQEPNKPILQETVETNVTRKPTKTEVRITQETKDSRKATKLETKEPEPTAIPEESADSVDTIQSIKAQEPIAQKSLQTPEPKNTQAIKSKKSRKSTKAQETAASKAAKKTKTSTETKKLTKQEKPDSEIVQESSENEMQCNECDKKFARRESLKIHKRVHTGEKPFVCDICQKSFRAKQNLTMHKKFHMGDASKTFECEHCDKKFMRNTDLKVHMRTHTGEKKFKCGICLQGYASKVNVQTHIERDHLSADGVVGTPPRGKKKSGPNFKVLREELEYQKKIIEELQKAKREKEPSTQTLPLPPPPPSPPALIQEQMPAETLHYTEHDSDMHDLNADPVNDIIEQIQNEILLNEQARQQENGQANSVTFTINTLPDTNEALKLHNDTEINNTTSIIIEPQPNELLNSPVDIKPTLLQVVKRYVCDQCNRTFKKHIRLVEHQRVHTGEKPFGCDQCGKQFRIRMRLNEHKLRHSKDKKFKCEICGLGCCTKQDLNLHMRHHTNDRRFQCSMCPKAFVRSSDLKIHVRVHTGEKPYVCDICHKCFRANQNLSVHKKSHMGEASKTYQCEHCEKKFMRNIDRKVHMRSHTGEKPYKCEICQRGYSSKFNVRAHIERDHISANGVGTPPKGKRKPGPKPKGLKAELEKQKKLIEELQHQLLQQIKTDEKIIPSEEEILPHDTLQDCTITASSPHTSSSNDPIQNAYDLLNKLKSAATTSKPLTIIPSPPPMGEPASNPFTKAKKACSTLLPLTITQKIEQHSPVPSTSSNTSLSCLTTPSPPKTTATKVVSQKTSLGIQQVSVTVSMQVENVTTANPTNLEKENAGILTTSTSGATTTTTTATSVKKERKITSYFTVVGQKADA